MNNPLPRLRRLYNQFLGLFPSKLPAGMTAFNAFADSIFATYTLPTTKQRDVRWMVATIIANTRGEFQYKSKYSFAKSIRAACVKEIAGSAMFLLREEIKQEASQAAAAPVSPPAAVNVQATT